MRSRPKCHGPTPPRPAGTRPFGIGAGVHEESSSHMPAKRIVVLGSGMVGSAVALDLARDPAFEVTVADVRADHLARVAEKTGVRTAERDLSSPAAVTAFVADYDLAVGALPSAVGLQTVK